MVIDRAQPGNSRTLAEFMEHAHIGSAPPMSQMRKAPPRALFREQPCDGIEGMGWRQERQ